MNIFLEAKEKLGLTYADIGDAIGYDRNYIHNMLNGTRSFNKSNLVRIAKFLNIDKEFAIKAWKEMELERLKKLYEKSKKALDADCDKILKMFDEKTA